MRSLLNSHVSARHGENKPISTCEICGQTFKRTEIFKRHMLLHAGVKVGKECEHCGEWMSTPGNMYYHELVSNFTQTISTLCYSVLRD